MKYLKYMAICMLLAMPAKADSETKSTMEYSKIKEVKVFTNINAVYFAGVKHACVAQDQPQRFLLNPEIFYMYTMLMDAYVHDWGVNISYKCTDMPSQGGNVPIVTAVRIQKNK